MKKTLTIYFSVLSFFVSAQKRVDLDRFSFTAQYRSLPAMKIDSSYHTFNVVTEATKLMQPFFKDLSPEQTVAINGWKKLPEKGHIIIKINLEDLLPQAVSVKERVESIRNRQGQITGTRTYYSEEVKYSFGAYATVSDYKGAHIMDISLSDRTNRYTYKSPEFALRPLAEGYFMLNTFKITADLYRQRVNDAMHYLSENLTENLGYKEVSSTDIMWLVGSRKHPEYEAHRQAFQQLTDVLFSMSANDSIELIREKVKPAIDYFEGIKQQYTSTNKHDRKMRYASFYNLAVLYYYLDDAQAMMKQAQGLRLNDYDSRDANGFEQTAVWLKNLFEKNNIYTRHFKLDVAAFKGPFEKDEATVKKIVKR